MNGTHLRPVFGGENIIKKRGKLWTSHVTSALEGSTRYRKMADTNTSGRAS